MNLVMQERGDSERLLVMFASQIQRLDRRRPVISVEVLSTRGFAN